MRPQNLGINSEVFAEMREKFDKVLTLALTKMQKMGLREGKVTATVDIDISEIDMEGETGWEPEFKCQVGLSLPLKGKIPAGVQTGLRMVKDPSGEGFIIATGQYSFFDMLEDMNDVADGE